MKVSIGSLILLNAVSAQQVADIFDAVSKVLPADFTDNVHNLT